MIDDQVGFEMVKAIWASLILAALTVSYQSSAVALISGGRIGGLEKPTADVVLATMIGSESRQPLDVGGRKRHAATGFMACPTGRTNIHVVGSARARSHVVVTTAHQFFDDACDARPISACKLYFPYSGDGRAFNIKTATIKLGGCSRKGDYRLDWAVFELDRPVPKIEPYSIPELTGPAVPAGTAVLTIAAHSRNFTPYHQERCEIRERYRFTRIPLQNDCDNVKSSGSAQFFADQLPRLVLGAIMVAETLTYDELSGREYDGAKHFNISVPLELDFLDAVYESLKAVKSRSRP